jgi:hypothetical protein
MTDMLRRVILVNSVDAILVIDSKLTRIGESRSGEGLPMGEGGGISDVGREQALDLKSKVMSVRCVKRGYLQLCIIRR